MENKKVLVNTILIYGVLVFVFLFKLYHACLGNVLTCGDANLPPSQFSQIRLLNNIRTNAIDLARRHFPSPHSELLIGMTVGTDLFRDLPIFKKMLSTTGTIHVVVVSGYNISLLFNSVIKILGTKYKLKYLLIAFSATFFYALLSGFEPPVIRAWVMGVIIAMGKYYGKGIDGLKVLLFSGLVILIIQPLYIYSLSFILSFMATLGLILYSEPFLKLFTRVFSSKSVLVEDFSTTMGVQLILWPIISYKFGVIGLLSPLINAIILWTVPLITILGGIFLLFGAYVGNVLGPILFFPLELFTLVIEYFAKYEFITLDLQISLNTLILYYVVLFVLTRVLVSKS